MIDEQEIAPYRKKKDQKSKSEKRSNHKHIYEKIIMQSILGWQWAERCIQCGRKKYRFKLNCNDFVKPEYRDYPYLSQSFFYTFEELKEKYPDIDIVL